MSGCSKTHVSKPRISRKTLSKSSPRVAGSGTSSDAAVVVVTSATVVDVESVVAVVVVVLSEGRHRCLPSTR